MKTTTEKINLTHEDTLTQTRDAIIKMVLESGENLFECQQMLTDAILTVCVCYRKADIENIKKQMPN
jgi:hypothetical protein